MIGRLRGELAEVLGGELILDVRGVGYRVAVGPNRALGYAMGDELTLQISTQVREDAIALFGFATRAEREAFELLITMPKIGPKLALAVLDTLGLGPLARAVNADDSRALTKVPGVGAKTAQRLVLDLKGKLPAHFVVDASGAPQATPEAQAKSDDPLPLALARLGYRKSEIDRALSGLELHGLAEADLQTRLSAALRILSGSTP